MRSSLSTSLITVSTAVQSKDSKTVSEKQLLKHEAKDSPTLFESQLYLPSFDLAWAQTALAFVSVLHYVHRNHQDYYGRVVALATGLTTPRTGLIKLKTTTCREYLYPKGRYKVNRTTLWYNEVDDEVEDTLVQVEVLDTRGN